MVVYWRGSRGLIWIMRCPAFHPRLRLALICVFVSVAQAQQLSFTPFHKSGIYELGEKAGWTVTLAQDAGVPVSKYTYVIKKNNLDVIQEGTLDFSTGSATIETMLAERAMLYVEVMPGGIRTPGTMIHLGAAIAPEKLQPSVPRPADFDSFWDAKLKSLSEIPINPVLTPVPTSRAGVDLHTGKLDSVGSYVQ